MSRTATWPTQYSTVLLLGPPTRRGMIQRQAGLQVGHSARRLCGATPVIVQVNKLVDQRGG